MGKRTRRRSNRGKFFAGEPDGLQPGDDLGNRIKRGQSAVPPDDIGNRRPPEETLRLPADDLGNRIEAAPTHENSGVLADITGRRRGRGRKGKGAPLRIGRYIVGGVNPLVAGNTARAMKAHEEHHERKSSADAARRDLRAEQAQRTRFFDFDEDDRYTYELKSEPAAKQNEAGDAVDKVLKHAGREAKVVAHLVEDGERPKVLVTIDEAEGESTPLFGMESPALMSLNYLVNKIVNRYPDDRIRLAILPAAEERAWRDSLAAHRAQAVEEPAPKAKPKPRRAARPKAPAAEVERVSIGAFEIPKAGGARGTEDEPKKPE